MGRKRAARKNGLDKRYEEITVKSLASGWKITLISIYLLFLVIVGVQFEVLGILFLVHMVGWTFSIAYYHLKF
ncbi:hypothetical protein [Lysinibacillus macroides]|uniref:Uncharacterized protein n=1 Tax=Lysinibacillus macroides TaxID=33935 RepID=A0A0N0CUH5_9BACI|nr:hypothetical protein [Lysinibacillus macroides]KOY80355.1 hypothetical protein ADM90_21190 [Lysinibacillus macroides]